MVWGAIAGGLASGVAGGLLGGGGSKGGGGKPREFDLDNPFFSAYLNRVKGPDIMRSGPKGALANLQEELFGNADLFRGMAVNNQGADMARNLGMDYLGGLQQYDPYELAQMQYGLLSPMMLEDQNQQFLNMEGRQFSQGRLGSVPGSNQMNALFDSHEDSRRKLLGDSFGQGLAAQQQQANLASQMLQLDPSLRGLFMNLGGQALGGGLDIQSASNDTFRAMSGAQGSSNQSQSPSFGNMIGAGLLNSGVGQITNGINGLFNSSPTNTQAYGGYSPGAGYNPRISGNPYQ